MHCHHRQWTGDRRRPNLSQTAMSNGSDGGIDVAQVAMWRTEKGWSKGKQNKNKKYGKERTRERGYNLVLEMLHESHTHTRGCALSFLLSPCGIVALCNVRIDHFHYYCYYYSKRVKNQSNRPRYGLTCCGICGESTRCCCSSDRILARIGGVCGA